MSDGGEPGAAHGDVTAGPHLAQLVWSHQLPRAARLPCMIAIGCWQENIVKPQTSPIIPPLCAVTYCGILMSDASELKWRFPLKAAMCMR